MPDKDWINQGQEWLNRVFGRPQRPRTLYCRSLDWYYEATAPPKEVPLPPWVTNISQAIAYVDEFLNRWSHRN